MKITFNHLNPNNIVSKTSTIYQSSSPVPSSLIHHIEYHALLPALLLTLCLLLNWMSYCPACVTEWHPFLFTLPLRFHAFFPSCCERQWDITVTLCCDASTHLKECTLHL